MEKTTIWLILGIIALLCVTVLLTVIILKAFVNNDTNYKSFYTKFAALYDNADTASDDFDGPICIALLGNSTPEIQANLKDARVGDEVLFDVESANVMNIRDKKSNDVIGYIFIARSGFIKKVADNPENYYGRVMNYYYIQDKKEVEIEISRRK